MSKGDIGDFVTIEDYDEYKQYMVKITDNIYKDGFQYRGEVYHDSHDAGMILSFNESDIIRYNTGKNSN